MASSKDIVVIDMLDFQGIEMGDTDLYQSETTNGNIKAIKDEEESKGYDSAEKEFESSPCIR